MFWFFIMTILIGVAVCVLAVIVETRRYKATMEELVAVASQEDDAGHVWDEGSVGQPTTGGEAVVRSVDRVIPADLLGNIEEKLDRILASLGEMGARQQALVLAQESGAAGQTEIGRRQVKLDREQDRLVSGQVEFNSKQEQLSGAVSALSQKVDELAAGIWASRAPSTTRSIRWRGNDAFAEGWETDTEAYRGMRDRLWQRLEGVLGSGEEALRLNQAAVRDLRDRRMGQGRQELNVNGASRETEAA